LNRIGERVMKKAMPFLTQHLDVSGAGAAAAK